MNKQQLITTVTAKLKLIRTEKNYTQDRMAEVIGMSKKTLIQIEKGRAEANWSHVIAICALFQESEILEATLGDSPLNVVATVAHERLNTPKKTLGGKVWWTEVESIESYRIQQNLLSQHYRILDEKDCHLFSSFYYEDAKIRLLELTEPNAYILSNLPTVKSNV